MEFIKKIFNDIEILIASVFFAIMLIVILLQIFLRAAGTGISWAEELARYLMIWGCCLGVSAATKRRAQVSIDAIVDHVPFKISYLIRLAIDIIEFVLFVFAFIFGCMFTLKAIESGQTMPSLRAPIWLVYLAFPVGFGSSAIRQLVCTVQALKDPKSRCGITDETANTEGKVVQN